MASRNIPSAQLTEISMSLRILARLTGSIFDTSVLNGALTVATLFDGEVDALFVRPDPRLTMATSDADDYAAAFKAIYETLEASGAEHAKKVHKSFEKWCDSHNLALGRSHNGATARSAHWHEAVGSESSILAKMARVSDLTVMARPTDSLVDRLDPALEAALMLTGRPVLLVPPKMHANAELSRILVAWNDSAEAARAIGAALPLLKAAAKVKVFSVAEGGVEETDADHLVSYLESRDIRVSKATDSNHRGNSVEEQLMSAIKQTKADLLVMGAYSHNRVKEMIFGGVTKHMLSQAPVPTFIMH